MMCERTSMSEATEVPAKPTDRDARVADLRLRSVEQLMSRYQFSWSHAKHVHFLAARIGSQLASELLLGPESLQLLNYAALLHDIGWHVGGSGHHHHSYDLIKGGRLSGFAPVQVEQIALVARYHRKARPKLRHQAFARLNTIDRQAVSNLAGIVRMADGLDRSHRSAVEDVAVELGRRRVRLVLKTRFDDIEPELTAVDRKKKLLESVLRRSTVVTVGPDRPDPRNTSW